MGCAEQAGPRPGHSGEPAASSGHFSESRGLQDLSNRKRCRQCGVCAWGFGTCKQLSVVTAFCGTCRPGCQGGRQQLRCGQEARAAPGGGGLPLACVCAVWVGSEKSALRQWGSRAPPPSPAPCQLRPGRQRSVALRCLSVDDGDIELWFPGRCTWGSGGCCGRGWRLVGSESVAVSLTPARAPVLGPRAVTVGTEVGEAGVGAVSPCPRVWL